MRGCRYLVLALGSVAGVLLAGGSAGAAGTALPSYGNVTCHGGSIKSGNYHSLRIAGQCTLPAGRTVNVHEDLVVAGHATLNAVTQSTLNVEDNVLIGDDAVAGLGCTPEEGCATLTNNHIGGSLHARGAFAVLLEQEKIRGNATIAGGGGSTDCGSTGFFGGPYFLSFEDSSVGGNVSVSGVHSCWFGFIRNHVGGSVAIYQNRFGDPDAMEIVTNTIGGNLGCFNNVPQAHVGDSGGSRNIVGGEKRGECRKL